jgi:hypothetical protein
VQTVDRADPVLSEMVERLADESVRNLFMAFCRQVETFSDRIEMEISPFEVRFQDPPEFRVRVAPYRDLFRVSIDSPNPCEIRVSAEEGYVSALDIALKSFLDARARAFEQTGADHHAGQGALPPASRP